MLAKPAEFGEDVLIREGGRITVPEFLKAGH
jgi:hypothetical protein